GSTAASAAWSQALASTGPRDTDPTALLGAVHRGLVHERATGEVDVLPAWPDEWRGQPLDARDVPTRSGPVSFSVRWHGQRPAVLWEAPEGTRLRIPGLDPAWTTTDARGESLLGPSD